MGEIEENMQARRLFNRLHSIILNWVGRFGLLENYFYIDPDELETVSKLFERLQKMEIEDHVMMDKMVDMQSCLLSITQSNSERH